MDRSIFWIGNKGEEPKDLHYWQSQTYSKRLEEMENLRIKMFSYHYGDEYIKQGLQRVYTVVK